MVSVAVPPPTLAASSAVASGPFCPTPAASAAAAASPTSVNVGAPGGEKIRTPVKRPPSGETATELCRLYTGVSNSSGLY